MTMSWYMILMILRLLNNLLIVIERFYNFTVDDQGYSGTPERETVDDCQRA